MRRNQLKTGVNLIGNVGGASGFNQTGDQAGGNGQPIIDPLLEPLALNGGTTPTHGLQLGSPAVDTGDCAGCSLDQRGFPRPVDLADYPNAADGADKGAFEAQQLAPLCQTSTAQVSGGGTIRPGQSAVVTVTVSGGSAPYTITLANGGGTRTGASPLSFTLGPQATTTYTVTAGTDANGCPITATGSATITVDGTPPTITCPGNQTAVIAGTTGPVTYPAPTVSDNRQGATFSCARPSGADFPLGTTTVTCTATDAAGNTATCSFTVTVRQPRPAIKDLIARVRALMPPLNTEQANGLIGHLELANTRLERGQTAQACTHLRNFITHLDGLVSGRQLGAAQGQALLDYANQIRAAVGCSS